VFFRLQFFCSKKINGEKKHRYAAAAGSAVLCTGRTKLCFAVFFRLQFFYSKKINGGKKHRSAAAAGSAAGCAERKKRLHYFQTK